LSRKRAGGNPLNVVSLSLTELQGGHALVSAVCNGLRFVVGAGFHDPSAGDYNDSIHMPHGGETVSVISTMGADCSEKQAELIVSLVKPNGRVWIASDGDKAGERHAQALLTLISPHRFVRWIKMADGKQPTDLSAEQLKMSFPP
jgi:hypothetical protein